MSSGSGNHHVLDRLVERIARQVARRQSRRGFLAKLGTLLVGAGIMPLLPVARGGEAEGKHPHDPGDPQSCDYWRYCGFDSYLCACCGGSHNRCPPGTVPAAITWIGTCRNPADGRNYIISYNDCCGQSSCGRCPCSRHEGAKPIYSAYKSNDIDWCTGTGYSFVPTCSTAVVLGVVKDDQS